jgi:hypothetical protein
MKVEVMLQDVRLWLILLLWPLFRDVVLAEQYAALWCITKQCKMCDTLLCKEASFCWRCGILQMHAPAKQVERNTDPLRKLALDELDTLIQYGVRLRGRRPVKAYSQEKRKQ